MTPSIAAGCAGQAHMCEHRDVRVRAGARPARSAGKSSQPDVGSTVMPGANGFGGFPRKESNPRRGTARKKTWMSCRATADESLGPVMRRADDLGLPQKGEKNYT